mgnify:CR=1 FL=1
MKLIYLPLICVLIFAACSINQPDEETAAPGATDMEHEIHVLINKHRTSIGKQALVFNTTIMEICREHSYNMANGIVPFSHDGFYDRVDRIRSLIGGTSAGENVAAGFTSAESVVNGWLNSAGHRANIEGNYTTTGIGVVKSPGGCLYFTQIFLNK